MAAHTWEFLEHDELRGAGCYWPTAGRAAGHSHDMARTHYGSISLRAGSSLLATLTSAGFLLHHVNTPLRVNADAAIGTHVATNETQDLQAGGWTLADELVPQHLYKGFRVLLNCVPL